MRRLLAIMSVCLVCLGTAGWATAGDSVPPTAGPDGYIAPVCGDPDVATLAAVDCAGIEGVPSLDPADVLNPPTVDSLAAAAAAEAAKEPSPADLPAYCREHVNVAFYTSGDWVRLGQKLLADASPCADYFITLPPLAADKTGLRCAQDDLIRALGLRFHPVAEFHFAGWDAWVKAVPGRTFADAAREFLRRVKDCGYDFTLGETWSLNEVHSGVRKDNGASRPNMRLLLDTLASGAGEMPASRGFAWVIGVGQNTTNFSLYKPELENWLQDGAFWSDIADDVSIWGQEAYPDMRFWGVTDASRNERTSNLSDYLEHFLLLGENAPAAVQPALDFLERTYVPLASAAWPWTTGFGNTAFSDDQMKRFVAEQAYAVKHFSLSRPQLAPDGRIAFAWSPNTNRCPSPDAPGTTVACDAKLFGQLTGGILDRLASSIHYAYEQGGSSQAGACGPPDDHSWCSADIPSAAFNPLWPGFSDWSASG